MRIRSNTYQKVCHLISNNIRDLVRTHSNPVLGLATGSTPIGIYQELSKMRDTNFSDTITFNLDEYVGLNGWHPQSYNHFMYEHLFGNLTFKKRFFPSLNGVDLYDDLISQMREQGKVLAPLAMPYLRKHFGNFTLMKNNPSH